MTSSLKQLCIDLDDTLSEFFVVQQDILTQQHELSLILKDGYFLMAKARYTMGATAVSCLQYNKHDLDKAQVKIVADGKSFSLMQKGIETCQSDFQGIRRRGVQEIESSIENIDLTDGTETKERGKNPLNWFGILVPQALRQSQSRFKNSVDICCSLSTLKTKYIDLQNKYRELLEQKHNLLNESIDSENLD